VYEGGDGADLKREALSPPSGGRGGPGGRLVRCAGPSPSSVSGRKRDPADDPGW